MMGKLFVAAIFVVMFGVPLGTHAATLAKPANHLGLIGFWSFDEGVGTRVLDASGQGNAGTLSGSTLPTWVSGKHGNALSFNGSTSYIEGPTPSGPIGAVTIAGWIKISAYSPWSSILDRYGGESLDCLSLGFDDTTGSKLMFMWNNPEPYGNRVVANSDLPLNQWVHIAASSNGSNVTFYINGVADGTQTSGAPCTTGPLEFGVNFAGGDEYFNGLIDDLRVFSRALSASEIQSLYKSGEAKVKAASMTGLVGSWNFNEGAGNMALDGSGLSNTGTLTGSTLPTWTNGKHGKALSFDGSSSYIDAGNSINLNGNFSGLTLCAWIKPTNLSGTRLIVGKWRQQAANDHFALFTSGTSLLLAVANGSQGEVGTSAGTLIANQWQYACSTWVQSTKVQTIYINGVSVGSGSQSGTGINQSSDQSLKIGAQVNGSFRGFSGSIDDVRVYNRALSAAEVMSLYKSGEVKTNVDTASGSLLSGLVGYWPFNGADVTDKVYDRSGKARNAYVYNVATSSLLSIGKVGQALKFTGTVTQFTAASGFSEIGTANQPYTISTWIKPKTSSVTGDIVHVSASSDGTGWCLSMLQTVSGKAFALSWLAGGPTTVTGATTLLANTWYHVVHTWDATNGLRVYVNGVLDGSTAQATFSASGVSNYVFVGGAGSAGASCSTDAGSGFNGSIDEVRMYSRALTAAEVRALYLAGK